MRSDHVGSNIRAEQKVPQRLRKLIGTVMIVVLVVVYALVATAIAASKLADTGAWVHLAYFFFTGIFWIVPAMLIIKWMLRPDLQN